MHPNIMENIDALLTPEPMAPINRRPTTVNTVLIRLQILIFDSLYFFIYLVICSISRELGFLSAFGLESFDILIEFFQMLQKAGAFWIFKSTKIYSLYITVIK